MRHKLNRTELALLLLPVIGLAAWAFTLYSREEQEKQNKYAVPGVPAIRHDGVYVDLKFHNLVGQSSIGSVAVLYMRFYPDKTVLTCGFSPSTPREEVMRHFDAGKSKPVGTMAAGRYHVQGDTVSFIVAPRDKQWTKHYTGRIAGDHLALHSLIRSTSPPNYTRQGSVRLDFEEVE